MSVGSVGTLSPPRAPSTERFPLAGATVVVACVALTLAVRAPLAVTVIGLICFGILHNALEIRYVAGRFADILTGRLLALLLVLVTGVALCRALAAVGVAGAGAAEIVLGYTVLATGTWWGLRGPVRWSLLSVLALGLIASLGAPAWHFVVLTHLHNLVPLVFLWEWARRLPPARRSAFRAAQLGWVVAIPLVVLAGALDPWIGRSAGIVEGFVGNGAKVIAASAPPGEIATTWGLRFLVVFAFLQTMHYVVWVAFLPRVAPEATAAFERRVPELRGPRIWWVGLGVGAVLAVLFWADWSQGKAAYATIASYHAYLEFPVLLALLLSPRHSPNSPDRRGIHP